MNNNNRLNMATKENDPRCRTILKLCKDLGLRVHFQLWLNSLGEGNLNLNQLLAQQPENADRLLDGIISALESASPVPAGESPPVNTVFNLETCTLDSLLNEKLNMATYDEPPMDAAVTTESGLPMSQVSAVPELQEELREQFDQGQVRDRMTAIEEGQDKHDLQAEAERIVADLKQAEGGVDEDTLEGFREHLKETRARVDLQMAASAQLEQKFTEAEDRFGRLEKDMLDVIDGKHTPKVPQSATSLPQNEVVAITAAILDEVRKVCVLRSELTGIVDRGHDQ